MQSGWCPCRGWIFQRLHVLLRGVLRERKEADVQLTTVSMFFGSEPSDTQVQHLNTSYASHLAFMHEQEGSISEPLQPWLEPLITAPVLTAARQIEPDSFKQKDRVRTKGDLQRSSDKEDQASSLVDYPS